MSETDNRSKNTGGKFDFKKHIRKIKFNIIDEKPQEGGFESKVDLDDGKSVCDPLGMYTGVPENRYEKPVQDVDDL